MGDKAKISLDVNGRDYAVAVEPRMTLGDALREMCGLTGTHLGCEHGVCGTCTVIVANEPVRSCLMFAVQASGKPIRTVEGLATADELHPGAACLHALPWPPVRLLHARISDACGQREPQTTDGELVHILSANLCRCTGYQHILKAVRAAASEMGLN